MGTTMLMSLADFEKIEQGADRIELLKGELIRMPPAQRRHMEIAKKLFRVLDAWARDRAQIEMGYLLSDDPRSWLQPDVSVTHPGQGGDRYYEGAPLVAFEIVSENDMARDLARKVTAYLANGSAEVWVIYPEERYAWVYTAAGARLEKETIRSESLPGIEIALNDILSV